MWKMKFHMEVVFPIEMISNSDVLNTHVVVSQVEATC